MPPSTRRSVPVTKEAAGLRRNAAAVAISSGWPVRPAAEAATMPRIPSPWGPASSSSPIGVEVMPGLIELIRA